MGTASIKKFLKQVAGMLTEEAALTTSDGAADADKIPALNASGVLDKSILNAVSVSTGASDSEKTVILGNDGRISATMMPVGVGQDLQILTASEALSSGNYVNIWENSGAKVRKADATTAGKEAVGFVLASAAPGDQVTVYFEGMNTGVSAQSPGLVFLSTTAGLGTSIPPSGSGNVVQTVGIATSATSVNFQWTRPVLLS